MCGNSVLCILLLVFDLPRPASLGLDFEVSRTWNGTYTIVNKANGRRVSSSSHGFSAITQGPIELDHRWRLVAQGNDTFAIINDANGMRIYAQAGRDRHDGFLTIDYGPIYQDQMWRLLDLEDGSFALINVRSGRRLMARTGFEGGLGFMAVSGEGPLCDEQAWWLINQDQDESRLLCQKVRAECATRLKHVAGNVSVVSSSSLSGEPSDLALVANESNKELDAQKKNNTRLVEQLGLAILRLRLLTDNCKELEQTCQQGLPAEGLSKPSSAQASYDKSVFQLLSTSSLMSTLLLVVLCCLRRLHSNRKGTQGKSIDSRCRPNADSQMVVAEAQDTLARDMPFYVSHTDYAGEPARIIKIQCPGVQHADVEINLIWNGCDITIKRQASVGVLAMTWSKRFEFKQEEGLYEFKEDQMLLEHGFLHLVFRAYRFQNRAVRFPQHFSLAASDADTCWDYSADSAVDETVGYETVKSEVCTSLASRSTASTPRH
mmetsp:Transcript_144851/g.255312  ORF Transcript_144851/g.255312 Transcript_144851/m.255312 type:complete len:490 (-) Transcript_144851:57-1526(-)